MKNKISNLKIFPCLTIALLQLPLLTKCDLNPTKKSIERDIKRFMRNEHVPSISIAVAKDGKIVWEQSYGFSDREAQIKATPNTLYNLASISKVYTSTAIMTLVEQGLIELDVPVDKYLTDFKIKSYGADASGVTVRRILQHTSGLPMFWETFTDADSEYFRTPQQTLKRFCILAFEPGERFLYSNLGIGLIHYIIEQIKQRPYAVLMDEEIFEPLNLRATKVLQSEVKAKNIARQYDTEGNLFSDENPRGSAVYASAHDLVRFGMFHLKHSISESAPIFSDSLIDLMQNSIEPLSNYGLCWAVRSHRGWKSIEFTGASGVIIKLIPDADLAVTVLSNRMLAYVNPICSDICDMVLSEIQSDGRCETFTISRRIQLPTLHPDSLRGTWQGYIITGDDSLAIQMQFAGDKKAKMRRMIDGHWEEWVETMPSLKGTYSNDVYSAYFPIEIPDKTTKRRRHWTWIYIKPQSDILKGYAVAHAEGGPYFGLPFYIQMERINL